MHLAGVWNKVSNYLIKSSTKSKCLLNMLSCDSFIDDKHIRDCQIIKGSGSHLQSQNVRLDEK